MSEITPETGTPKLWRDMTREEKGALLLADREGKVIEAHVRADIWRPIEVVGYAYWSDLIAYRICPEPKRESVTMYAGSDGYSWEYWSRFRDEDDTHRITFDLIDGKPDCASIRMEALDKPEMDG